MNEVNQEVFLESVNRIEELKKQYGASNLVEMIHMFLSKENQDNQIKRVADGRTGKFYPSSVGQCKRKIAYQMMGYPGKPISGQSLLIMENGTSFHNRMEDIFGRMGIMIAPELSLKHADLRISGRSDAIIYNFLKEEDEPDGPIIKLYKPGEEQVLVYEGPNNDVLIVEFKSIKSKGYNDYLPKTKPKKEHEMQLQLYFFLTGIRKGLVFYENKDTQEEKYFIVEYNEEMVNSIISDIKYIIECIDKGDLPEREYQPVDIKCRYCDFRDICYPDFNSIDYDKIL
jgi:CRISPR/Cas system-associated exonuclease Cas4 (RecB family)